MPNNAKTDEEVIETLRHHVDRLRSLLLNPQPGLFTWRAMVAGHWKTLAELWKQVADAK